MFGFAIESLVLFGNAGTLVRIEFDIGHLIYKL